jgi:hypothetical protein
METLPNEKVIDRTVKGLDAVDDYRSSTGVVELARRR